jgi:hypothetical protein
MLDGILSACTGVRRCDECDEFRLEIEVVHQGCSKAQRKQVLVNRSRQETILSTQECFHTVL